MVEAIKAMLMNQYEAAFCTLNRCIDRCPDGAWDEPVVNHAFCETVFHTLFYADFYLGNDEASFREQAFHRDRPEFFRDYEEFEDRAPVLVYDRQAVKAYLAHCRGKASEVIAAATAEDFSAPCGFPRRNFSRAELHVYNIRHIQHHAAQLTMRLRIDSGEDVAWIGSGWT